MKTFIEVLIRIICGISGGILLTLGIISLIPFLLLLLLFIVSLVVIGGLVFLTSAGGLILLIRASINKIEDKKLTGNER